MQFKDFLTEADAGPYTLKAAEHGGKTAVAIKTTEPRGTHAMVIRKLVMHNLSSAGNPIGNARKLGVTDIRALSGGKLARRYDFKANGALFVFADKSPEEAMKAAEEILGWAKHHGQKEADRQAKYKADAPKRKKEAAKYNAAAQKRRKEELEAKYGKDVVKRVKVKNDRTAGDDGNQWYVEVDGHVVADGLNQYSAQSEQRQRWRKLADEEKARIGRKGTGKEGDHWEDRISGAQHEKCSKAIDVYRKSRKSRGDADKLYDVLTNNGVKDDEASEIVNLENQG